MFEHEQTEVQSLRMALDERSVELDSLRKKLNREISMNGLLEHSKSPSKHESDEIKGLKYDI
jgi:CAP-Gly domain-containing linker protein 1